MPNGKRARDIAGLLEGRSAQAMVALPCLSKSRFKASAKACCWVQPCSSAIAFTCRTAASASRAELIWLPDQIALFESVASFELKLALTLALHTGQREGDLLKLPWSAYDGCAGPNNRRAKRNSHRSSPSGSSNHRGSPRRYSHSRS